VLSLLFMRDVLVAMFLWLLLRRQLLTLFTWTSNEHDKFHSAQVTRKRPRHCWVISCAELHCAELTKFSHWYWTIEVPTLRIDKAVPLAIRETRILLKFGRRMRSTVPSFSKSLLKNSQPFHRNTSWYKRTAEIHRNIDEWMLMELPAFTFSCSR